MIVDVWHDTVCPWCRIGKAHLDAALARWDGAAPEVRFRAFFLNPRIPPGGEEFRAYMAAKMGGAAALPAMFERVRQASADAGVDFHFDRIGRAPNTELSHRLLALAPVGQERAAVEAVYRAYFEEGRDIGDPEELVRIAGEVGMDPASTRAPLRGEAGRAEVLADVEAARRIGVTGVPFFVFDERGALSGAHPPATLLAALRQVAAETEGAAREG